MSEHAGMSSAQLASATDEELMALIATGNKAAFAALYDRFAPRVLGLIRRVLVDSAQSEEVAQEVFLELWQHAPSFDTSKGRALSWVLTMTHRRAVDRVRASQASRTRDVKVGIRDYSDANAYDSVAETVETTVMGDVVKVAMAALTDLQRQAVSLAYYDGLTQREISEQLSVPLGTVKTRLRDGLVRLRAQMQQLGVASI